MKQLLYIVPLLLSAFFAKAQTDTAGTVFVSNDFRASNSNAISVKWIALKVYYPDGFHVYRQAKGESNWTKLTASPITVSKTVPPALSLQDPNMVTFLDNVNKVTYAEFQKSVMRVFVVIKAIKSPEFAELLGVVHNDETAQSGISYRYQVKGITGIAETLINTSPYITSGNYVATQPPQNIIIDRKRKVININWKYEDSRYYGVNIYRSTNGRAFEKITPQERHIQYTPGKDGVPILPEIFFEDYDIKKEEIYTYKLTCIDYFGQESGFSPEVKMETIDFDAPPAPTALKGEVHFKEVKLSWSPILVDDLTGFNIYRHHHVGEEKTKLNSALLEKVTTNFKDEVKETGIYYYSVGAVDAAENESFSGEIMIDVHDIFPPTIPQNVRILADSGQFTLTWDAVPDKDLKGYFVYRSLNDDNNDDNEFIGVNKEPITETSYIDKLPKHVRNKFVYTVVAMDTSFNYSAHSNISVVQLPDVTPPQAPFIRNIHTEPGKIRIDWLPNHETDIKSYQIYRSSAVDSANYVLLGEVTVEKPTTFEDKTARVGVEYYYYLKAIDLQNNISTLSNIYEGLVFNDSKSYIDEELKELTVKDVKIKHNRKKRQVELSWQNPDSPQLLGVVIYRGTTENDLEPLTGLQQIEQYSDTDIKGSKQFVYQLRTFDVNGHKIMSNTYTVIISE